MRPNRPLEVYKEIFKKEPPEDRNTFRGCKTHKMHPKTGCIFFWPKCFRVWIPASAGMTY